jgi:PAS domain S-box-containing protein
MSHRGPLRFLFAVMTEPVQTASQPRAEIAALRARVAQLEGRASVARLPDAEASRQTLDALVATAPMGIAVVRDRVIERCNEAFERIFGYASGELLGQSTRLLMQSDEQWIALGRDHRAAFSAAGTAQFEDDLVRKDGTLICCLVRGQPLDPADHSRGFVVACVDITASRAREQALREALLERDAIIAGAPIGLSIIKGRVLQRCSAHAHRILGYAPGALEGRSTRVLYPSDEAWRHAGEAIYPVLAAGQPYQGEFEYVTSAGESIICNVQGAPIDPSDHSKGFLFSYEDITERKRQEEWLRAMFMEQRALYDATPVSVMLVRDRRITRVNRSAEKVLGYAPGEMVGMPVRNLSRATRTTRSWEVRRMPRSRTARSGSTSSPMYARTASGSGFWARA